jgi:hypothetical protein
VYRLIITLHLKSQKIKDVRIHKVTRLESLVTCQFISKCDLVYRTGEFEKIKKKIPSEQKLVACAVGTKI